MNKTPTRTNNKSNAVILPGSLDGRVICPASTDRAAAGDVLA